MLDVGLHQLALGVGAVVAMAAVNYRGVQKTALLTRVIVAFVVVLAVALPYWRLVGEPLRAGL